MSRAQVLLVLFELYEAKQDDIPKREAIEKALKAIENLMWPHYLTT